MMSPKSTSRIPRGGDGVRPSSPAERRFGLRMWLELPVDVLVDGFPHRCRMVDASSTGMVVELAKAIAAREPELLHTYEIHVSAEKVLHVHARTIWRSGAIQAVRFVGLGDDEQAGIAEMIIAEMISNALGRRGRDRPSRAIPIR